MATPATTSGGASAGSSSRTAPARQGARGRDRPLGPRARSSSPPRRDSSRPRTAAAPGRTATAMAWSRAPPPSWCSTRSNLGASTRSHSGTASSSPWTTGSTGCAARSGSAIRSSLPWPSTRSTIRCTWGPCLPTGSGRARDFGDTFTRIDRAPDAPPGEFLDLSGRGHHGRSEQPQHRLLRRPRHRHMAIAGRRRKLDQRRLDASADCDRRPDRLQHRLRGFSVRRRSQEHRRRRVIHRKEQRPAGSHAPAARRRCARGPSPQ